MCYTDNSLLSRVRNFLWLESVPFRFFLKNREIGAKELSELFLGCSFKLKYQRCNI